MITISAAMLRDPEHVDPRGHVGRLAVGQQSLGRQRLDAFFAATLTVQDFDGVPARRS